MTSTKKHFDLILLIGFSFIFFFKSLDIYFLSENISHIEKAGQNLVEFVYGYYFRPVSSLTVQLDRLIWTTNYFGYHFSNLVYHTLTSILVYILAFKFLQNRFFAITSSFLFLIHPIHSVSIFWISGRSDIICSIFYLSSLILFITFVHSGKIKYQTLSVITFVFALFSKEMAVSLPIILFFYYVIFSNSELKIRLTRGIKKTLPHIVILVLFFIFKILVIKERAFTNVYHSNLNILQIIKNFASYIGLLIIPGGHIAFADFFKEYPLIFWFSSILILAVFIISLFWIRKSKHLIFFVGFILITLLPVIRLVMRWYLYIPSVGFCLALSYGLYKMYQFDWGKKLSILSLILLSLLYSGFLHLEQYRWVKAGEMSEKISFQVAQVISEQNYDNYIFLNVPAEFHEIPVMIFGMESLINFRLRNDLNAPKNIEINAMSYISFKDSQDLNKMRIQKLQNGIYKLDLSATQSNFIFPHSPEVVNKKKHLNMAEIVDNDIGNIQIVGINDKREVDQIVVTVNDKSIPILYYENGKIRIDESLENNY